MVTREEYSYIEMSDYESSVSLLQTSLKQDFGKQGGPFEIFLLVSDSTV